MVSVELAPRFLDAQHWWLAAELARRHPELAIVETHPALGAADCLTLVRGWRWMVSIERVGQVHLHDAGALNISTGMDFEANKRYELLGTIEDWGNLSEPAITPPTTPRSLAYRVAAQLMLLTSNDKLRLDIRSELIDTGDHPCATRGGLRGFPIAQERSRQAQPDDPMGHALHRYWLVLRGDAVVAVLDTDGFAYVGEQVFYMPTIYAAHGRKLISVMHTCFAGILR